MIFSFNRLYPACSTVTILSAAFWYIVVYLIVYIYLVVQHVLLYGPPVCVVQVAREYSPTWRKDCPGQTPDNIQLLILSFLLLITNNRPLWLYSAAFRPPSSIY